MANRSLLRAWCLCAALAAASLLWTVPPFWQDGYDVVSPGAYVIQEEDRINLNTAPAAELACLPNIGEVKAQRIVQYRKENGSFTSVEELALVEGISDKTVQAARGLVSVS